MQINRLFEMIYILMNRRLVTAKELAAHFEVSQRTIYRDIEVLCQSGIPIYTTKGKGGGIHLMDNFVLNKALLSETEQTEILSALQGLNATSYIDINQMIEKLSIVFNKNMVNWIEVDFSGWSQAGQGKFKMIKEAILNRKLISFDYYGSNGEMSKRCTAPRQLWFKLNSWYLKAFCYGKQAERTFKLNRMKRLKIEENSDSEKLPAEKQPKPPFDQKQAGAIQMNLELKIRANQAFRVYDEFEEENIQKMPTGDFLVTVSFEEEEWLYSYLLSFGSALEVVKPDLIRDRIRLRIEEMLGQYTQ